MEHLGVWIKTDLLSSFNFEKYAPPCKPCGFAKVKPLKSIRDIYEGGYVRKAETVYDDKNKKTIQVDGSCGAWIPDSKMQIIKTFEGFVHHPY